MSALIDKATAVGRTPCRESWARINCAMRQSWHARR